MGNAIESATENDDGTPPITVRAFVREVITEVAPEELPLLDAMAGFDDRVVVRRLRRRGGGDTLGFGMAALAALATPVVWIVLDRITERATEAAADGVIDYAKVLFRRRFRGRSEPATVPALTAEQIVEVRQQVLEAGLRRGLDEERAKAVADGVAQRLAAMGGGPPGPEPEGGGV